MLKIYSLLHTRYVAWKSKTQRLIFIIKCSKLLCLTLSAMSANNYNGLGSSPAQRHVVDQSQALKIIQAAAKKSVDITTPANIAVVDPSGTLVSFLRTDNAWAASIDIAMKKAKTVALFNGTFTSAQLQDLVIPGGGLYGAQETNGGLVVFGGGLPLFVDGFFIGAVGVSGGTVEQDTEICQAGVEAVNGKLTEAQKAPK
jgi:uncharacterized protein GlcG (DUF336 family)